MKKSEVLKKVETAVESIGGYIHTVDSIHSIGEIDSLSTPDIPAGEYTLISVCVAVPTDN